MGRGRFPFYAVRHGRTVGIFSHWEDCKKSVLNFKEAVHKGFFTVKEAEKFLNSDNAGEEGDSSWGGSSSRSHENMSRSGICSLEFDGACRASSPRQGGAGCIICNEYGEVVYELRVGLGDVTSSTAEYLALIYGMRTALHLGMRKLQDRDDSQLVVRQVAGEFHVDLWRSIIAK